MFTSKNNWRFPLMNMAVKTFPQLDNISIFFSRNQYIKSIRRTTVHLKFPHELKPL